MRCCGTVPDVSDLIIFGSPCMYQVPAEKRTKPKDRFIIGIMLGYASQNFQPEVFASLSVGRRLVEFPVPIPAPSAVPEEEEESGAGLADVLSWRDDDEEEESGAGLADDLS
eukprot:gene18801-25347_t